MSATNLREMKRLSRHRRVRRKVSGIAERPRVAVHRSGKNLQCQIVDDLLQKTICSFITIDKEFKKQAPKGNTVDAAKLFGKFVADKLKSKGIASISFDRAGYRYHGRVKAFADALREGGIEF